jgi:hypothetical protein
MRKEGRIGRKKEKGQEGRRMGKKEEKRIGRKEKGWEGRKKKRIGRKNGGWEGRTKDGKDGRRLERKDWKEGR